MIELLDTKPSLADAPDAIELDVPSGALEFDDVTFEYERNPELHKKEQKQRGR